MVDRIADDDALPPADCPALALSQIELLVAVERSDISPDAVFESRVRIVADRLLALFADDDRNEAIN